MKARRLLAAIAISLVAWVADGAHGWPVDPIVIALIVYPRLPFVKAAEAARLAKREEQQRKKEQEDLRDRAQFVFVQPQVEIRKQVPLPIWLVTSISPFISSTSFLTTASPRPVPSSFVVKRGSNM